MNDVSSSDPADRRAGPPLGRRRRSAARLAAVQTLYRVGLTEDPLPEAIAHFEENPIAETSDDGLPVDIEYYRAVVYGVGDRLADLDGMVEGCLDTGRTLDRMELVLAAILRVGSA